MKRAQRLTQRLTQRLAPRLIRTGAWLAISWIGLAVCAPAETWQRFPDYGRCTGSPDCDRRPIEVPLSDQSVEQVRFFARDDVGQGDGALLRISVDSVTLERGLEIDRRGRIYTLDARGARGRYLVFEAINDEVVVEAIEVLYKEREQRERSEGLRSLPRSLPTDPRRSLPPDPSRSLPPDPSRSLPRSLPPPPSRPRSVDPPRAGTAARDAHPEPYRDPATPWKSYPNDFGCIGGELCQGDGLQIRLTGEPVEAIQFFAHDDFGDKHQGKLRVSLDDHRLERRLDVEWRGRVHRLDAGGIRANYLMFEAVTNDEVMVDDIEVLYRQPTSYTAPRTHVDAPPAPSLGGRYLAGYDGPGHCMGGSLCSQRYRIEVQLESQPLSGIRFFAHSDVGESGHGRLRLLLDHQVLRDDLDVSRTGDFFEIDLDGVRARYLTFEAIDREEVVIEDIEVNYGQSWIRQRVEEGAADLGR